MSGALYLADPGEDLVTVELDGLSVLYHAPSGTTHIVAPPAPQILAALGLGPAEPDEILARIRAWHDVEDEDPAAIEARLDELELAGLVRRL